MEHLLADESGDQPCLILFRVLRRASPGIRAVMRVDPISSPAVRRLLAVYPDDIVFGSIPADSDNRSALQTRPDR